MMEKLLKVFFMTVLVFAIIGCAGGNQNKADTLAKAKSEGRIMVGFANEKPFAYTDEYGKITGEAVEIARAILNPASFPISHWSFSVNRTGGAFRN